MSRKLELEVKKDLEDRLRKFLKFSSRGNQPEFTISKDDNKFDLTYNKNGTSKVKLLEPEPRKNQLKIGCPEFKKKLEEFLKNS